MSSYTPHRLKELIDEYERAKDNSTPEKTRQIRNEMEKELRSYEKEEGIPPTIFPVTEVVEKIVVKNIFIDRETGEVLDPTSENKERNIKKEEVENPIVEKNEEVEDTEIILNEMGEVIKNNALYLEKGKFHESIVVMAFLFTGSIFIVLYLFAIIKLNI